MREIYLFQVVQCLYAERFLILFCGMSTALIKAQNLHQYYADTHAVNDVSIELHQGDILGLLGPNGAGKSTTIQMLSGVLAPSAGQISINGIDLLDQPIKAKSQIGYLPDKPPLYPELTVDEYLNYAAGLRRIKRANISSLREQAKQRCGLEGYGKRLIANLSKGYQQRVGIAQAIIHQPEVIILDEPTVGLDPIQIREIRQLIAELGQQHGVILSTHILPEVQAVCTKVLVINQGELVFSGNMETLNKRMECQSLIIGFKQPPEISQLLEVAGIEQLEQISISRFKASVDNSIDVAQNIISASIDNNWGLQELTPERQTLESIFVELTTTDTSLHTNEAVTDGAEKTA